MIAIFNGLCYMYGWIPLRDEIEILRSRPMKTERVKHTGIEEWLQWLHPI